jgi:hypothetical protein
MHEQSNSETKAFILFKDNGPSMPAGPISIQQQGKLADIIRASEAWKVARTSGFELCCAEKFAGPQYYPSHRFCATKEISIPQGLIDGPFNPPYAPKFTLPRFIPLVNPVDDRTYAHKHLPGTFPVVVVQSWSLFRNSAELQRAKSKGLNDMLGFDGKIILSSVMPDKYIVEKGLDWFVRTVEALNPDAVTTWDVPTYSNHPRMSSLNWLMRGLDAARLMSSKLNIPLIGLVAGADLPQIRLSSACLLAMGFDHQALPCEQLLRDRQLRFLEASIATIKESCPSLMLLSCSHPRLFRRMSLADHFVGMSWFNQAIRGKYLMETRREIKGEEKEPNLTSLLIENLLATIDALNDPQLNSQLKLEEVL